MRELYIYIYIIYIYTLQQIRTKQSKTKKKQRGPLKEKQENTYLLYFADKHTHTHKERADARNLFKRTDKSKNRDGGLLYRGKNKEKKR